MGHLTLSESYLTRLTLIPSFMTQTVQRYSTSKTSGPSMLQILIIFTGNPDVDSLRVVDDAFSLSFHVGSGIVPVNRLGQISYGHCLYHSLPFCSITCILFHQSIFLHLILYLLSPCLFRSSSTTTHFKFQSLHYHIFIFFPQNMTVPPHTTCFSIPFKPVQTY